MSILFLTTLMMDRQTHTITTYYIYLITMKRDKGAMVQTMPKS